MSNDNNQNENIKNDKFSLYTEKINPKKPKKKNKKLNNNIVIYEIVRKIYYIALRQNLKVYFFALNLY